MAGSQIIDVPGHGQVEFPESMSDADIVSAIQTLSPAPPTKSLQSRAVDAAKNIYAVPDAALSLGTGAIGQVAGGLAGLGQGVKNLFTDGGMPAGSRVEQVQNAMTYQPRSEAGQNILGGLDKMLGFIPRGADRAGEATANVLGPAAGAAVNTGLQALPTLLTKVAKAPIAGALARAETQAATDTALAAPRSAALLKGRDMGLVASPAEANPSLVNRTAEGLAGQAKTQQLVSSKNQPKLNAVARNDVGLRPDEPISIDSLDAVRENAALAYKDVGDLPVRKAVAPSLLMNDPGVPGVNPAQLVQELRKSRNDAQKWYRSYARSANPDDEVKADTAWATSQKIDGTLESYAAELGRTDLVQKMREARQLIAKTYDVQKSLKGNNVDAKVIEKLGDKGKLTGGLADIAEFAKQYPGAVQVPTKNAYVPTPWELGMGGVAAAGGLGLHLAGAGLPLAGGAIAAGAARPLLRSVITSSPYQNLMVRPQTFGPGLGLRTAGALSQNPALVGALSQAASQRKK